MATTAGGQPRPIAVWLTHHEVILTAAMLPLLVAQPFLTWLWPVMLLVGAVSDAASLSIVRHDRVLCLRCTDEMPLDGPGQAEQRLRWLALAHRHPGWTRYVGGATTLGYLVVVLTCPSWVVALVGLVSWSWWLVLSVASRWHRRLDPWCPWCHDDDGDDDEDVVDPEPSPVAEATR